MVRVNQARNRFFDQGTVPNGLMPDVIVRSWQRSRDCGVPVDQQPANLPILNAAKLSEAQEAGKDLIQYSKPVMDNLFEQIRHTSSMVLLTDALGTVLHSLGDPAFVGKASKVSLQPGGVWAEETRGTNAIGTCLVEKTPVVIHRGEHFSTSNHFLTCSAAPIIDPFGHIKGVLDLSSDSRAYQQHTRALVCISAQQIENMMFSRGFSEDFVLHFHRHPQFIGTFYEGIVVFTPQGRLAAANRSALLQLGIDRYLLEGLSFAELFDLSFDQLCHQAMSGGQPALELHSKQGKTFFVRIKSRPQSMTKGGFILSARSVNMREAKKPPPPALQLDDLTLGDHHMQRAIDRARKVLNHDIPIMLEGESGTGKELFAQALHQAGQRRNSPFVALNCAAIPAELIEAELFGYQEGAFTGARRKGYIGKIRQADGGTVFLDEIGDMPMKLQARLLRVLQERSVSPLGGITEHPVDIAVICATNRKMRDEILAGRFREDLYYRLNGLLLTLPPLRQRTDLLPLAEAILAGLAPIGRDLHLSPEVTELFTQHPWPGNIRQLHNLLRTAVALMDENSNLIDIDQLPEDFIEQQPKETRPLTRILGHETRLDDLEQVAINQALRDCPGNLSAAARRLGISRTTLYRKLEKAQS
jgi:transcriptional regulator of acetoin/glycerol metabolism